jgi:hypothetical protein
MAAASLAVWNVVDAIPADADQVGGSQVCCRGGGLRVAVFLRVVARWVVGIRAGVDQEDGSQVCFQADVLRVAVFLRAVLRWVVEILVDDLLPVDCPLLVS